MRESLVGWKMAAAVAVGLGMGFVGQARALPVGDLYFGDPRHQARLEERRANGALQAFDFEGVIALSNCSASLVRLETDLPEDPAWVLTNGHCIGGIFGGGMPKPGEVIVNRSVRRQVRLMDSTGQRVVGTLSTTRLVYATMTRTDFAIYELDKNYREIEGQYRTRPLTLASRKGDLGEPIQVLSGYWKRGYSCAIEAFIPTLREAGWTMSDSIRYSRPGCEVIGGTSGSPVVSGLTREVIGVNNTGNESGEECTMNNPCEVDEAGNIRAEKGFSYGQQVRWIYGCLASGRTLDLKRPECELPKP